MIKGICKYCGQEKELINSHIIPKNLCQIDKNGPMVGIDSLTKTFDHNPIHQNGAKAYLLCKECDNLLGKLDRYGSKVFKKIIPNHKWDIVDGVELCKLLPDEVDYWTLKKFLISVLWRASVDKNGPDLGRYENIALKILKEELPDNSNYFVPFVYILDTKTPLDFSMGIFGNKTLGKHIYIIHFPHYEVMIIPSAEHSRDPKLMELYKALFNCNHIIVQKFSIPTLIDQQLINTLKICQKNELQKKKKL
ncbi:MAG: hypothetical protein IKS41_05995 [Alphaproteobacteria bacterium]|nr:hypothetical protein [Alphaproteobacteria bacterium]